VTERLDEQAVRHVAHLARLTVSDEEVALFSRQLSAILEYVAQLDALDTGDVPPTAHPLPVANVLRDDVVGECVSNEAALANAPDAQGPMFRVSKVLDQDTA
jgi:aspartyl-tRNA(Asn)/glutamyl-tRNA(Gln) amidotransferase subunit C